MSTGQAVFLGVAGTVIAAIIGVAVFFGVQGGSDDSKAASSSASVPATASSTHDYPTWVQSNFLSACTGTGGTPSNCTCALDTFQERYTLEQYAELESNILRYGLSAVPPEFMSIIEKCRR